MEITVTGAGLTGLIFCHELLERGYQEKIIVIDPGFDGHAPVLKPLEAGRRSIFTASFAAEKFLRFGGIVKTPGITRMLSWKLDDEANVERAFCADMRQAGISFCVLDDQKLQAILLERAMEHENVEFLANTPGPEPETRNSDMLERPAVAGVGAADNSKPCGTRSDMSSKQLLIDATNLGVHPTPGKRTAKLTLSKGIAECDAQTIYTFTGTRETLGRLSWIAPTRRIDAEKGVWEVDVVLGDFSRLGEIGTASQYPSQVGLIEGKEWHVPECGGTGFRLLECERDRRVIEVNAGKPEAPFAENGTACLHLSCPSPLFINTFMPNAWMADMLAEKIASDGGRPEDLPKWFMENLPWDYAQSRVLLALREKGQLWQFYPTIAKMHADGRIDGATMRHIITRERLPLPVAFRVMAANPMGTRRLAGCAVRAAADRFCNNLRA